MDIFRYAPCDWPPAKLADYGVFGDYVGGVWGTLLALVTVIILLFTWKLTKSTDARNSTLAILAEMLKTHDSIVSMELHSSGVILRDFSAAYKIVAKINEANENWSVDDRINIAYLFSFFGPSSQVVKLLSRYNAEDIKKIHDKIANLRNRSQSRNIRSFTGHQQTISHYMRNLFGMFVVIDGSKLSKSEKYALGKVVRTKLSNYDQALLAVNIISDLGRAWEQDGILQKFKPIANVPAGFFGVDRAISLKNRFPSIEFEWERIGASRPRYFTKRLGRVSFVTVIYGNP